MSVSDGLCCISNTAARRSDLYLPPTYRFATVDAKPNGERNRHQRKSRRLWRRTEALPWRYRFSKCRVVQRYTRERIFTKLADAQHEITQIQQHIFEVQTYEGESNENLKSAIKIPNTVRLSCKLTTVIMMVWRVVDRWQYDAGMQHDGAVVV